MKLPSARRKGLRNRNDNRIMALKSVLRYLWDVYSAPAPASKEVLTLLSLCLVMAMVTGGPLYLWLSGTLRYDRETSTKTACVYGVTVFFLSFLCHPLRCVLTMALPTLCSKQGRKLVVSASFMVLVLNVLPNVMANTGAVVQIFKCTSEGFARTLLKSSDLWNRVKGDLASESMKVKSDNMNMVTYLQKFDHFTQIDLSEVRSVFRNVSRRMETNFSHARNLLKEYKLLSNRILAAIFLVLLLLESACYLKSYLTSLQFDNAHLSKEVLQKANDAEQQIASSEQVIRPANCKITNEECSSCFISLVLVTLNFAAMALMIVLDYVVYHVVQMNVPLLLDLPAISARIGVSFKVYSFVPALCNIPQYCVKHQLTDFHRDYLLAFSAEASGCDVTRSAPNLMIPVLLGFLWLLSYGLVFLEVYARRVRRQVCASFFKTQEARRAAFLLKKIRLKQQGKEEEILSVQTAHG
ncbi:osteoclast stimulatory transmembrane protein [Lampris incognitus]|uniref:osteoclast stimulatory transmembrane protein n=1 Tax=Lampris incognitus TaxID=2546036 RepID=UPI0024B5C6FA|nr:osteoclast stimulatory transmembrane protein [Lampris incognitus]